MGDAMPQLVLDTLARVAGADDLAARSAGPDLIGREDRRGLQIATGPAFPADQASRRVGAAQMQRAVRHAAGLADACVLLAGGLLIHAAPRDAVVRAEVLGADRAARRAGLTGAVVVPADHQRRRRAAAMWTGHDPGGRTGRA